jgi:hypothetical protein
MTINLEKAPRKARTQKLAVAPNYTLAPAEPCPFVGVPTPVPGPVNPPEFVACAFTKIKNFDWSVTLNSDNNVSIVTSSGLIAFGKFVTSLRWTEYGYSVTSEIVDVAPAGAVSADVLRDLSSNLTFFAMRAGRFSGGKVA